MKGLRVLTRATREHRWTDSPPVERVGAAALTHGLSRCHDCGADWWDAEPSCPATRRRPNYEPSGLEIA